MRMGSSASGGVTMMHDAEAMIGRKFQTHREFNGGDLPATFAQSDCSVDVANGWDSAWSFVAADNTRLGQIGSGSYDTRIVNWVKSVPAGHKVGFTFCHEANAKLGTSSLATQITAFQRLGSVFDQMRSDGVQQVTSGNVYSVICLTNAMYFGKGSSIQNQYNAAIAAVDCLALDSYGGAAGDTRNFPNYNADYFQWWDSTGSSVGAGRWGLWETSASDVKGSIANKSAYIEDGIRLCFQHDAEFYHAFNSTVGGSQPYFNRQVYADLFRAGMDLYADDTTPPPPLICPAGTDRAGQTVPAGQTIASWCTIPVAGTPVTPYAPMAGSYQYVRLG